MALKVLAVDDDPSFLKMLKASLSALGHDVCAVSSAQLALDLLDQPSHEFELIMTDISMPILDGIELIKRVRTTDTLIPIVAMSGGGRMNGMDHLDLAVDAGANKRLNKPFDLNELNQAIYFDSP